MATNRLAVLTPYPIPEALAGRKVVNLGDGFILRAIERQLGRFASNGCFSPRVAPSSAAEARMEESASVVLAGANQLNDRYTVWPGLRADRIRSGRFRFVPFGLGIHGEPGFNDGMSDETRGILEAIHDRIEYSSWRCPVTIRYLVNAVPQLQGRLLMTGCPVIYDKPLLESDRFHDGEKVIAVTVTERNEFWARESQTIDFVAKRFPRARRYLVLHQNYSPLSRMETLRRRFLPFDPKWPNPYQRLRWYAAKRGFRVIAPESADACIDFYRTVDLHFGSRLHAHLLFLSCNKRSFLTEVDGRSRGIAEFLGFPICDPANFDQYLDFDFELARSRARDGFATMRRFLESVPK
jgi:hypothetical protein